MDNNELLKRAHTNAVKHGFWKDKLSNEHCLMLVITEISELIEADRKSIRANAKMYGKIMDGYTPEDSPISFEHAFDTHIKGSIEEEFADIVIRLADLAGALGIEFDKLHPCRYYRAFGRFTFTENAFALCKGLSKEQIAIAKRIQFGFEYVKKWAEHMGIDLDWFIDKKMQYNENRPEKHDKKY